MQRDVAIKEREPDFFGGFFGEGQGCEVADASNSEELRSRGARLKEASDTLAEAARLLEDSEFSGSAGDLRVLSFRVLEEGTVTELAAAEAYAAEREELEDGVYEEAS